MPNTRPYTWPSHARKWHRESHLLVFLKYVTPEAWWQSDSSLGWCVNCCSWQADMLDGLEHKSFHSIKSYWRGENILFVNYMIHNKLCKNAARETQLLSDVLWVIKMIDGRFLYPNSLGINSEGNMFQSWSLSACQAIFWWANPRFICISCSTSICMMAQKKRNAFNMFVKPQEDTPWVLLRM